MEPTIMNYETEQIGDRRRVVRRKVSAAVAFCAGSAINWNSARVLNYSALGVRLRSRAQLSLGQQIVIVPANLKSAAIHGTIRWLKIAPLSIFERIILALGRWNTANPFSRIQTTISQTLGNDSIYEAGIEFPDQITDIHHRLSS